jgi:hypothetical protein
VVVAVRMTTRLQGVALLKKYHEAVWKCTVLALNPRCERIKQQAAGLASGRRMSGIRSAPTDSNRCTVAVSGGCNIYVETKTTATRPRAIRLLLPVRTRTGRTRTPRPAGWSDSDLDSDSRVCRLAGLGLGLGLPGLLAGRTRTGLVKTGLDS